MSNSFTAIDFETAHAKRFSICQVGLARIENGVTVHTYSKLVRPPENFYMYMNTRVHGIKAQHTVSSPTFADIWHEIKPYIDGQLVIAHNSSFDFSCLRETLNYYGIENPKYSGACTLKIFGVSLDKCCKKYNLPLNHHEALSDALACAELYKIFLNDKM